jgi:hypothetical protein
MKHYSLVKKRMCDGKRRRASKGAADAHARALNRRLGVCVHAYYCHHCRGWHVGHAPR